MDAATAFLLGVLFSWYFWPIAFLVALAFESFERNGFAVLASILAFIGISGFFDVGEFSWYTLGIGAAVYIVGGFLHAIWRWYRYVDRKVEELAEQLPKLKKDAVGDGQGAVTSDLGRDRLEIAVNTHKERTNYRNRLDTISYWVIMWPISGLAHLFGDIVKLVQKAISTFFSSLFDRITNKANAKLDIDLNNPHGTIEEDVSV